MMKYLLSLLLASSTILAQVPLILRHAVTPEEVAWGLMTCSHLDENEGMTFTLEYPTIPSFWMFNCKIPLSVAYLDQDKIIREIHTLHAYPEKMDPKRPVNSLRDFALYPTNDPVRQFFAQQSKQGKYLTSYALEMNLGFFEANDIHPLDLVIWDNHSPHGTISRAVDLNAHIDAKELVPCDNTVHPYILPGHEGIYQITFYDQDKQILAEKTLAGGNICIGPASAYLTITKKMHCKEQ